MKTKILVLSILSATFTFSALADGGAVSARAAANFPATRSVASTPVTVIAYVGSTKSSSPRAQANQIKVITNAVTDDASTLTCAKKMSGTPKTIQACTEHPATMPGCNPVAMMQ